MNIEIPLTINFDDRSPAGCVRITLDTSVPQLEQYYIVPSYTKDDSGGIEVTSYALVHRSMVASDDEMKRREGHLHL